MQRNVESVIMADERNICDEQLNEKIWKSSRKQIRRLFYWTGVGVVGSMSAMVALQTLQTSINVEGAEGAIALTAAYATSILFSIFFCPSLLRLLGPGITLAIGDVCYLVYCLSNVVPELIPLTIGAAISGIARSVFFPAYTNLVLELASSTAALSHNKSVAHYQNYYQSRFYGMLGSISTIGNIISYAILYAFATTSSSGSEPEVSAQNHSTNSTDIEMPSNPYAYCGVNDCQDPNIVHGSIDQYVPPAQYSVYILILVTCFICLCSTLIHSLIFPGIGRFGHKLEKISNKALGQTYKTCGNNNAFAGKELTYENQAYSNDENDTVAKIPENANENGSIKNAVENTANTAHEDPRRTSEGNDNFSGTRDMLKATAVFFAKPRAIMLNVSAFRYGMMLGFVFADVTRAYASCVAGVEMTGLFATCFGLTSLISALLYGKLTFRGRRRILYAASCVMELLLYVWCFLWFPSSDDIWVIFLLFAGFGILNGICPQNVVEAYIMHFEKRDVAFSVYNVFLLGGIGLQYGLSTFMCVRDKIYMQVAVVVAGAILFVIAEVMKSNESRRQKSENGPVEQMTYL